MTPQEDTVNQPNDTPDPVSPASGAPASHEPGYGQPAYQQPVYQQPVYQQPVYQQGPSGQRPLNPDDERNWAVGAHLSSFVAAYVALGFLGPLAVLLVAGPRSPFVRQHAVEALNFNLSALIYAIVCGILVFVLIGIPMLVALAVVYIVAIILGAVAASRGAQYRYPLTIRFVK